MERIVEYAKRVSEFRSLRKKTILVKEDEIVKNILSLVLQMFEVSAKEDNMIFDNLTINGKNEKLSLLFKINGIEYDENKLSDYPDIMMVAEKICEIEYNLKILYKLYLRAEELNKRVRSFRVAEYDGGEIPGTVRSITFAMDYNI